VPRCFGLQDEVYSGVGEGGADAIGLVADDGEHICRRDDASGGGDDVGEQWLAADFMQHFWQLRFEPRAFAGGMMAMATRARESKRLSRKVRRWISSFAPIYLTGKSTEEGCRVLIRFE